MQQLATEPAETLQSCFAEADHGESAASIFDSLNTIYQHRRLISAVTAAATAISAVAVFILPKSFKAEALIMPPQQQQSSIASLASGALGGLAASGMGSSLGLKNPGDLYIGILQSRTVADDILNRFHLRAVYDKKFDSDTRKALAKHVSFSTGKDSLIRIAVEDHDPKRAADVANAYIDELYKANSRLALTDASQRRLFFEQELAKEKDALAEAELALKKTQQKTGLVVPAGQAELLIRSGAQLRAEIASRQVQMQAMRSYATEENPQLQVIKREIGALQGELAQLQAKNGGPGFEMSAGQLPDASLEYIRAMRDLKYHETLYELLSRQYEAARIDEAKQAPVIQVVDRAVVPDNKSWPPRAILIATAFLFSAILTAIAVLATVRANSLLSYAGINATSESSQPGLNRLCR